MNRGFYTIMCAQFLSSLADNALLIAAIALLTSINAPDWMTPLLKLFFVVSYVCLAAWVGIFADSMPKGRVMFLTNFVKAVGCLLMLFGGHPLLAYAIVGVGAAAYSPAKYGILTELLPPQKLVVANGWIEGLTVGSIILGVVLGGVLIKPEIAQSILDLFHLDALGLSSFAEAAIFAIAFVYLAASAVNLAIPDMACAIPRRSSTPSTPSRASSRAAVFSGATVSVRSPSPSRRSSGAQAQCFSSSFSNGATTRSAWISLRVPSCRPS